MEPRRVDPRWGSSDSTAAGGAPPIIGHGRGTGRRPPCDPPTVLAAPSDPEWVKTTFTTLFEQHQGGLLRWLRARTRDEDVAQDCCQEAFARLLGQLRAGRPPDSPAAWLHHVARNLVVSRARHAQVVARAWGPPEQPFGADPTVRMIVDRELWVEVEAALRRLPDGERELLVLAAGGQTGAQLAHRLGISLVATRTRLHRARRRLRDQLDLDPADVPRRDRDPAPVG
jgi:RNA polymerase sigma-70 factor (ECF subfamily)